MGKIVREHVGVTAEKNGDTIPGEQQNQLEREHVEVPAEKNGDTIPGEQQNQLVIGKTIIGGLSEFKQYSTENKEITNIIEDAFANLENSKLDEKHKKFVNNLFGKFDVCC